MCTHRGWRIRLASRSSQTAQATPKGLLRLARAFGVRTRWQITIAPMDSVARNPLILNKLLRIDAPLKEAAEKGAQIITL